MMTFDGALRGAWACGVAHRRLNQRQLKPVHARMAAEGLPEGHAPGLQLVLQVSPSSFEKMHDLSELRAALHRGPSKHVVPPPRP